MMCHDKEARSINKEVMINNKTEVILLIENFQLYRKQTHCICRRYCMFTHYNWIHMGYSLHSYIWSNFSTEDREKNLYPDLVPTARDL